LQVKGLEIYRKDLFAVINIYTNIDRDDFFVPTYKHAKALLS
jgi:septum formation topological specificity factor MinE